MYFTHISHSLSTRNKLEVAILNYLKDKERLLIHNDILEDFKKSIPATIDALCKEHQKCKPISASWSNRNMEPKDFHLYISAGICSFHLYKSK